MNPLSFHGLALEMAAILALVMPVWLASLALRDASLIDRFWPAMIAAAALVAAAGADSGSAQVRLMLLLVLVWAVRLGIHLTRRNWGHGEDRRYAQMRARRGARFALFSLWGVYGLQALIAWIVALPFPIAMASASPLGWLDAIGVAICASGIAIEAVADAQLERFRSGPAQFGRVLDRGLWAWSRHPNYFGEACVWWGFGLIAAAAAGPRAAWALASPMLMTWLLLRVSGVGLLEADIADRRPAYRDYVRRTSAFLPWPPQRRRRV